jgi:hypothetical protein
VPAGTVQQFRNDGSAQMAVGATHTDFHVNLQYLSNEQICLGLSRRMSDLG